MKIKKHKNYPFMAAGRIWTIPAVTLSIHPDGSTGLSLAEIQRIQKAIANEICASTSPTTAEEMEFLRETPGTKI
jgi:hypothetical protein